MLSFYYAKSIWAAVKKDGFAKFYSYNNNKAKFGNFVCLHSERTAQFVKIADLKSNILLTLKTTG